MTHDYDIIGVGSVESEPGAVTVRADVCICVCHRLLSKEYMWPCDCKETMVLGCNSFKLIIAIQSSPHHFMIAHHWLVLVSKLRRSRRDELSSRPITSPHDSVARFDPGIWIVWMAKFFHVISWWKIVAVWSWQWSLPIRKHCWVASPHATERRQQARSHLQYHLQIQTDKKVII